MRRLAFVLTALLAASASAQPADHVEVVDAVLEAADLDATLSRIMGPMRQAMPGGADEIFSVDTLTDSLRARLVTDGRTDDLRSVLVYLQSPTNVALTAHGRRLMDQVSDPAGALAFQQRVAEQKKGTLANEALIRRYQAAQGTTEMVSEMMPRLFDAIAQASPEFAAMLEEEGGADALTRPMDDENLSEYTEAQVAAMRVALYGVPRDLVEQATAFAESEPGRYFARVSSEVTMDVMVPAVADFMAQMMSGFAELRDDDGIEIVEIPDAEPFADEPEIFDVAEIQPELIGGMETLSDAIVYPEEARLAGIEGRVIVQFVVDERGMVTDAVVMRSPNGLLSESALAAVRQLRFVPGKSDGRLVKVRFSLPVTFRLRDAAPDANRQ